jgi:hypothetical protein
MILKKIFSFNNYRYILYLALISFLFVSCQKKDPLVYFQKESSTIGYKKVNASTDKAKYEFGESSILNTSDSLRNLSIILPEITSYTDFEVYYSLFNQKEYTLVVLCNGLGEKLRNKMVYEKEVNNFSYKEIFNEKNAFISPVDENTVIMSSNMQDIRKAIKRSDNKSVISNQLISALKKEIPENAENWIITTDSNMISKMTNPLQKDSSSSFIKYSSNFKSLLFFNDGRSSLYIDGETHPEGTIQISKDITKESSGFNFIQLNSRIPSYKFSKFDINNNNNKFRIIIK